MTERPDDWMFREPAPEPAALFAPAAARNALPLAAALERLLPEAQTVLEVASGSGQHAVFFAQRFPWIVWQPSDADPAARASIQAWRRAAGLHNLRPPLALDAAAPDWAGSLEGGAWLSVIGAVLSANMIHIAPWRACLGLLEGAARLLPEGAPLILYGPFRRAGVPTAESNEAFDRSLKARDPAWGLRDLETVEAEAAARGLALAELLEMPANNLVVAFRRVGAATAGPGAAGDMAREDKAL